MAFRSPPPRDRGGGGQQSPVRSLSDDGGASGGEAARHLYPPRCQGALGYVERTRSTAGGRSDTMPRLAVKHTGARHARCLAAPWQSPPHYVGNGGCAAWPRGGG